MHAISEEPDGWGKDILQNTLLQAKTIQHMPENMVRDVFIPHPQDWFPKQGNIPNEDKGEFW